MPGPVHTSVVIDGGRPLRGAAELPPDREVGHRTLVLAALAEGESQLAAKIAGRLLMSTVEALRKLGAAVEVGPDAAFIQGRGLDGLRLPDGALDCGASYTTLALLTGVLAGQRFGTRLLLDRGCAAGRLDHLVGALRARGAHVAASGAQGERLQPPVAVAPLLPDEPLRGLSCELPDPDANAKSALLLSGLFAQGPTSLSEPLLSADHTERLLSALHVPVRRLGSLAGFDPAQWDRRLPAFGPWSLPGDTTAAAFVAAAAASIEGSRIALRDTGFNPTRTGFFDALRLLGGRLLVIAKGDCAGHEPIAELQVQPCAVRGGVLGGEVVLRAGDALPSLLLIGARSSRGVRILEGDVLAGPEDAIWPQLAELARGFGAPCLADGASLAIEPSPRLRGHVVDAREDHRLALTAVIFGLAAEGTTRVDNATCLSDHFPGLLALLRELGAQLEVEEAHP
jgi:3-phosphoshikimate 1-carboxyvinyltransferase